jgi:DNA recombination protein RmuC
VNVTGVAVLAIVAIAAAALTWLVTRTIAAMEQENRRLRDELERHHGRTLRDAFQSLAADALKDSRESFLSQAQTSFEKYRQPIEDTLTRVEQRLGEAERERVSAYVQLAEQIKALDARTGTLSRALRTPAVRGRWGEMQLRRVVEMAGMLQRCDFDEQPGLLSDGSRLRPDVIVHLPGGKQIVVDAKAPLDAFLDAQDSPDDETRTAKLQAHARQVRDHMDKLGAKAYWEQLQSPEMVVMFLPGETLFSAALQHDLQLIEYGLQQKVLVASPITLIALLTTVAHSWRQDALNENYREVARLGREFYDRLSIFAGHFDEIRKKLDGAVQAYNDAAGSLESRVMVSARRLRELQVTTGAEIPTAEPVERTPRLLKQMELIEEAQGLRAKAQAGPEA